MVHLLVSEAEEDSNAYRRIGLSFRAWRRSAPRVKELLQWRRSLYDIERYPHLPELPCWKRQTLRII